jgi:hypothetical protein
LHRLLAGPGRTVVRARIVVSRGDDTTGPDATATRRRKPDASPLASSPAGEEQLPEPAVVCSSRRAGRGDHRALTSSPETLAALHASATPPTRARLEDEIRACSNSKSLGRGPPVVFGRSNPLANRAASRPHREPPTGRQARRKACRHHSRHLLCLCSRVVDGHVASQLVARLVLERDPQPYPETGRRGK